MKTISLIVSAFSMHDSVLDVLLRWTTHHLYYAKDQLVCDKSFNLFMRLDNMFVSCAAFIDLPRGAHSASPLIMTEIIEVMYRDIIVTMMSCYAYSSILISFEWLPLNRIHCCLLRVVVNTCLPTILEKYHIVVHMESPG